MSNAYHNVFGYLIPALIGIVGANMQGTTERLLQTHTTNIWSFLITTAIYCYAYLAHQENSSQSWAIHQEYSSQWAAHQENSSQSWAAHQENSSQSWAAHHENSSQWAAHQENSSQSWALVAVVSGSVSALSLISTFVPRSDIGHIILYTAWLCSSITIVVHQYGALFTEACRQLYNEALKPFCINICSRFQSNDTSSAGQQRPRLPV